MTARLAATVLAALVMALAGCGGGDDSNDAGSGSATTAPETRTDDGRAQGGGSTDETPERSAQGGDGEAQRGDQGAGSRDGNGRNRKRRQGEERLKLDDEKPAPPQKDDPERSSDLPTGPPTPKQDLTPQERQAYETAEFFCGREGIEGMRREYSIESTDPADVAREAARRYYDRSKEEAVYSGCLAGLRQAG